MDSKPRQARPALRQGLIFGIILTVVEIGFSFISASLGSLGSIIALAIYLVFGLLAGRRASMRTGKLGTGILAGLIAGLTSTIISSIVSIILTLPNLDALRQSLQQAANQQHVKVTYTNSLVIEVLAVSLIFALILGSLLALAGGAIGGYLGKGSAPTPPEEEYRESVPVPPTPSQPEQ